jgi:aspartyl-tRNA(Asn)/glutamyl-tRNA(Gln) amidotransferase subunit C
MASSKISTEAVRHVARLAALALTPAEEARMQSELDSILGYMAELDELDVSAVEPTFHAVAFNTQLRPDVVAPSTAREELLRSAPAHESGGFAVPKVMDGEG